jgi:hypothetical protein
MVIKSILNRDIPLKNAQKTIIAENKKDRSFPSQSPAGNTAEAEAPRKSTDFGRECSLSRYGEYREIWLVHFEFVRPPGERPSPTGLVASEYRGGRSLRLGEEIVSLGPPYPLGPDALFVTYNAPDALECHLALGWGIPERVLDFHAEFRCHTSGLLPPGDYSTVDALEHLGSGGEGTADNPRFGGEGPQGTILGGFTLRTEVKMVKFPERYMDDRGKSTWDKLLKFADGKKKSTDNACVLHTGN